MPVPPSVDNLRDLRVLVVDDNASNRMHPRGNAHQLADAGRRRWRAPAAALAELSRATDAGRPYHLVLTDALMPDVDGFTLARQIGADQRLAGVKVIMLTSAGLPHGGTPRHEHFGAADQTGEALRPARCDPERLRAGRFAGAARARPSVRPAPRHAQLPHTRRGRQSDEPEAGDHAARGARPRCHVVSDGRQAVAKAAERAYDIILMDVQMPEMRGFEATAAIRQRERGTGAHTPIVAMTAHAMAGDRERCLAAGMDEYVSKPLRAEELLSTIESGLLTGRRRRAAGATRRSRRAARKRRRQRAAAAGSGWRVPGRRPEADCGTRGRDQEP